MVHAWKAEGIRDAELLMTIGRSVLDPQPAVKVEYLGLADPIGLEPVEQVDAGAVAMIAARVGRTRLIDNVVFEQSAP
jgi:pantoate--beta-alanine ligase